METFVIALTNQNGLGVLHSFRRHMPAEDSTLTREELERFMSDLAGFKRPPEKITIMGGEPMEWHHDGWRVEDLAIELTTRGFPVEIVSNGHAFIERKRTIEFVSRIIQECRKPVTLKISADVWHANYCREENVSTPIEELQSAMRDTDYSFKLKIGVSWLTTNDSSLNMPPIFRSFCLKTGMAVDEKPLVIPDMDDPLAGYSPTLVPASLSKEGTGTELRRVLCEMATGGAGEDDMKVLALTHNSKFFNRCLHHRYLCANGTYWRCFDGETIEDFRIGHLGEVDTSILAGADDDKPFFRHVRRKGVMAVLDSFLEDHPEDREFISRILNKPKPFAYAGLYGCAICKALSAEGALGPLCEYLSDK